MSRTLRQQPRRRRAYRSSPLYRHRVRVRWLVAQRFRTRNYLRRFGIVGGGASGIDLDQPIVIVKADSDE